MPQQVETRIIMCVVDVKIDEAVLREVLPELDSTMAIRLWAQKVMDLHVQSLLEEARGAFEQNEEAQEIRETVNRMRMAYERGKAQGLSNDCIHEMVKEAGDLMDLETLRQNLHQMVEEVYSQP